MAPLDYVYEVEQVTELVHRALTVFDRVDDLRKVPEDLRVPVFNSIINMVATVRQPPPLIPQLPTRFGLGG